MKIENARQIAAQAWCKEKTKHKEMDVELAQAFAETLKQETDEYQKALDRVWRLLFKSIKISDHRGIAEAYVDYKQMQKDLK